MELQNIESINKLFRRNIILLIILVGIIALAFAVSFFFVSKQINNMQNTVLVLDKSGAAANASAVNADYMRVYEYENHVKTFIQLWYAFDENNYENNIKMGLEMLGDCGKDLLNQYNDLGMLNLLRQKNIHYNVAIKDIKVDMNTLPISGIVTVTQTGIRAKGQLSREMVIHFTLSDVSRSRENVHGCKIDTWNVQYSQPTITNSETQGENTNGQEEN